MIDDDWWWWWLTMMIDDDDDDDQWLMMMMMMMSVNIDSVSVCVVERMSHCSCFCWQHVLVDLVSTWLVPIELLYLTRTGTRALTHRPGRERGALVSHARSPSTDCWPLAPLRRKYITGIVYIAVIIYNLLFTCIESYWCINWLHLHCRLQQFVITYMSLLTLSAWNVV